MLWVILGDMRKVRGVEPHIPVQVVTRNCWTQYLVLHSSACKMRGGSWAYLLGGEGDLETLPLAQHCRGCQNWHPQIYCVQVQLQTPDQHEQQESALQ